MIDTAVTPLISIVMPSLNCEQFIGQAIKSVQEQTFANWELLIVDNGSEDNTPVIAAQAAESDLRIRCLVEDRKRSVAMARQRALQEARGEWIAFLDSDDIWEPDKLQIQMETAQSTGSSFLFTASTFMNSDGTQRDYVMHVPEQIGYPEILKQNLISCSSVLVRRELLENCFQETDNDVSDDFAAWIRILRDKSICATGIDLPLLHYRMSRTSLSFNKPKSALRAFKTYRHAGLSVPTALRYWVCYVFRNVRKYAHLRGRS